MLPLIGELAEPLWIRNRLGVHGHHWRNIDGLHQILAIDEVFSEDCSGSRVLQAQSTRCISDAHAVRPGHFDHLDEGFAFPLAHFGVAARV